MLSGSQQATTGRRGPSMATQASGSAPRPRSSTSRGPPTPHPALSSTPIPHRPALQQKAGPRQQQNNGATASYEAEQKSPGQVPKPTASAKPIQASPSTAKAITRPGVPEPSASASVGETQVLSQDVIDNLSSTFRKFVLKDKVVIVTGGARGLGLSMARALCESGIKALAIFDIQPSLGEGEAHSLNAATGIPVKYYNVDVTKQNTVEAAIRQVVQQYGGIDILVNSAGVAFSNLPAEDHQLETFQKTIDINLVGSFCVAQAVAKHMIAAAKKIAAGPNQRLPDRSIIFIASMSGSVVNYPQAQCAYNASKAGVVMLSKCLAGEWAKYGIRVNTVSPGYMDTVLNQTPALNEQKKIWKDRTPMKRLGQVEELNNLVVWLAGDGAKFVTGSDMKIDGGYSIY